MIPEPINRKPPFGELMPKQRSAYTLPPYPLLDQILYYFIEELLSVKEIIALGFEPDTVRWVARMVEKNEYKRKQAPPGLKVTTKAFGVGRRIPIAAKFDF